MVQTLESNKILRREFFGLSTFQFLAYFRRLIVYTFLAIFLRDNIGLSNFEVTLMATIGMIANASTQSFLWGKLIDRLHKPNLFVIIGETLAGLCHILMVLIYQPFLESEKYLSGYIIIFSLGLIEIFWSMSNVGWSTMIVEMTNNKERANIIAKLSMIGGIGGIFGAQIGGMVYDEGLGFINGIIFYIASIFMIASAIIVILLIKPRIIKENIIDDHRDEYEKKEIPKFSDLPVNVKKAYIWFIIALVIINFGRNSIAVLTGIFLTVAFNVGGEDIALFSNLGSIGSIITGLFVGTIVARLNDNKVLFIGVLSALTAIFWLTLSPIFVFSLVSGFLIGCSHVIIESSSYSIVANIIPEKFRGRLFGIYNATFFLSWGIAATLITGPIADVMIFIGYTEDSSYRVSFIIAAFIVVFGIIILKHSYKLINILNNDETKTVNEKSV